MVLGKFSATRSTSVPTSIAKATGHSPDLREARVQPAREEDKQIEGWSMPELKKDAEGI